MRWVLVLGYVVAAVSLAGAQVTPEEAQARLAERRAAATTQPSAEALGEYKAIVAQLREENAKLRAEVASLKAELKERPAPAPAPTPSTLDVHGQIAEWKSHLVGMTVDEAYQKARHIKAPTHRLQNGREVSDIYAPNAPSLIGASGSTQTYRMFWGPRSAYTFLVRDGKIISFSVD